MTGNGPPRSDADRSVQSRFRERKNNKEQKKLDDFRKLLEILLNITKHVFHYQYFTL